MFFCMGYISKGDLSKMAKIMKNRVLISEDKGKLILETVPSFTKKLSGLTEKTIAKTPKQVTQFIDAERENKKS